MKGDGEQLCGNKIRIFKDMPLVEGKSQ